MSYLRQLDGALEIRSTESVHAAQLEALQRLVFPTLAPSELLRAPHYRRHVELFPEGQFVAVEGQRVVGMTTSIRLTDAAARAPHAFAEIIQGGWCTTHDPHGEWLYGIDLGTHPEHRGRGIARALYRARHDTVRALGLRGQYVVGMLAGYGRVQDRMNVETYYDKVVRGELADPTVTAQMKIGFVPEGLVPDYVDDPACGNFGVRLTLSADAAWRG